MSFETVLLLLLILLCPLMHLWMCRPKKEKGEQSEEKGEKSCH